MFVHILVAACVCVCECIFITRSIKVLLTRISVYVYVHFMHILYNDNIINIHMTAEYVVLPDMVPEIDTHRRMQYLSKIYNHVWDVLVLAALWLHQQ